MSGLAIAMGAAASAIPVTEHLGSDGYRMSQYRAPTPASVPGARTLTVEALIELINDQEPALIDVLAVTVRPEAETELGISWLPNKPRYNIPGSVWLPNVGYGNLEPPMEAFFRNQLRRVTNGNLEKALVLYCIQDCWMSWNAARRAVAYGYTNVYWFPEGSDGWAQHGLPLAEAAPTPFSPFTGEGL